ncbi:MAG: hypothetical protein ACLQNE_39455 [Thermoguttaceae bacterium]|jgi:hypothetical protein
MHYSVEMLVRGRAEVVEYYRVAAERWGEIWHRPDAHDLARLSKMLSSEQMWFERNCGGRWVGQEVMVVSGLAGLYSTEVGFDDRLEQARLLYDAFQTSFCSVEVKSIAEEVARSYDLLNESRV